MWPLTVGGRRLAAPDQTAGATTATALHSALLFDNVPPHASARLLITGEWPPLVTRLIPFPDVKWNACGAVLLPRQRKSMVLDSVSISVLLNDVPGFLWVIFRAWRNVMNIKVELSCDISHRFPVYFTRVLRLPFKCFCRKKEKESENLCDLTRCCCRINHRTFSGEFFSQKFNFYRTIYVRPAAPSFLSQTTAGKTER